MASSPPALSNTPLSNPKKRPSIGHAITQPDLKRQKVQPHPLRQASYPDATALSFYSVQTPQSAHSETGSLANSIASASRPSSTGKRGRGRPRKSTTLNEDDLSASQAEAMGGATTRVGAPRGTKSVVSRRSANAEPDDDDDEADYGGIIDMRTMDEQEKARIEAEKKAEAQRIDRLTSTFTSEQSHRYNLWRASKLNKVTVRKIVNQTVSQSVTQVPLQAINIYSKFFVGEIIERARDVQVEWAKKVDERLKIDMKDISDEIAALGKYLESAKFAAKRENRDDSTPDEAEKNAAVQSEKVKLLKKLVELKESEKKSKLVKNPNKGGLLPDHLREALRRYKADGEGGGVGFESQSHALLGVHGPGTWRVGQGAGGRRLFR